MKLMTTEQWILKHPEDEAEIRRKQRKEEDKDYLEWDDMVSFFEQMGKQNEKRN